LKTEAERKRKMWRCKEKRENQKGKKSCRDYIWEEARNFED